MLIYKVQQFEGNTLYTTIKPEENDEEEKVIETYTREQFMDLCRGGEFESEVTREELIHIINELIS